MDDRGPCGTRPDELRARSRLTWVAVLALAGCGEPTTHAVAIDAGPDAPPPPPPPPIIRTWGTPAADIANGIAVDAARNRYVVGHTVGTFAGQTSAGSVDVFVTKLDATDEVRWTRQWGTTNADEGLAIFVDGDALLVVWQTPLGNGPQSEYRLRRVAAADGTLLGERALSTPPTAQFRRAVDDGAGLTIVGAVAQLDDLHATRAPWVARYRLDGELVASWQSHDWLQPIVCPPSGLTSVTVVDGEIVAGGEGVDYLPESCVRGYVARLSSALQLARTDVGDGNCGVLAAGGAMYTASGPLVFPWVTRIQRAGAWTVELAGLFQLGRGDAPTARTASNLDGPSMVLVLDPATGATRVIGVGDVFLQDVLAVQGAVLAVGAGLSEFPQSRDAYLLDAPP